MIRIVINDMAIEDAPEFAYNLNAELTLPDAATADECLFMYLKAMNISGYSDIAVNRSIINYADNIRIDYPGKYPQEVDE